MGVLWHIQAVVFCRGGFLSFHFSYVPNLPPFRKNIFLIPEICFSPIAFWIDFAHSRGFKKRPPPTEKVSVSSQRDLRVLHRLILADLLNFPHRVSVLGSSMVFPISAPVDISPIISSRSTPSILLVRSFCYRWVVCEFSVLV